MKHQKQLLTVLFDERSQYVASTAQRNATRKETGNSVKEIFPEAAQTDYNDTKWESVVIPHDWAIFGPFDEEERPAKCSSHTEL